MIPGENLEDGDLLVGSPVDDLVLKEARDTGSNSGASKDGIGDSLGSLGSI